MSTPTKLQPIVLQETSNNLITPRGIVVQVKAMSRVRLDIRLKRLRRRECQLALRGNRLRSATSVETVASTEGDIVRTGDDQNRAREGTLHRHTAHSQEFTNGNGLFVLLRESENLRVKVRGCEEEELVRDDVRAHQVTRRVV